MGDVVDFLKYKSMNITRTELETLCYTQPDPVIHHLLKLELSAFYGKWAERINDEEE